MQGISLFVFNQDDGAWMRFLLLSDTEVCGEGESVYLMDIVYTL